MNAGMHLAAPFNQKARLWVRGRKGLMQHIQEKMAGNLSPVIWMHAASLGEFEQGRPIIEHIRRLHPEYKIVISFFSPSGFENKKNYNGADQVFYLPPDRELYARQFVHAVNPSLVIWVKYEYWYHFLQTLHQKNIPVVLVSAVFRRNQAFFKPYGKIWRDMLGYFTHIFVQNKISARLLKTLHVENVSVAGDTRYDRVLQAVQSFEQLPAPIVDFCKDHPTLVAGSTWAEDEEELLHYIHTHGDMRFIIAPHETHKDQIAEVLERFPAAILYSELTGAHANRSSNCLVIDNVGMLSRLYSLADVCYVGGGFGDDGLHNILEPAAHAKPVIFGPNHDKFPEAQEMIDAGGAFEVAHALALEEKLNELFSNEIYRTYTGKAARAFIERNSGATSKILKWLQDNYFHLPDERRYN